MESKEIARWEQEFSAHCHREIIAGHCDDAACGSCPLNRAYSKMLHDAQSEDR